MCDYYCVVVVMLVVGLREKKGEKRKENPPQKNNSAIIDTSDNFPTISLQKINERRKGEKEMKREKGEGWDNLDQ